MIVMNNNYYMIISSEMLLEGEKKNLTQIWERNGRDLFR